VVGVNDWEIFVHVNNLGEVWNQTRDGGPGVGKTQETYFLGWSHEDEDVGFRWPILSGYIGTDRDSSPEAIPQNWEIA